MTAVVPANIGLVAAARTRSEARKFIAFSLSQRGQELLLDPKIVALPVLPAETLSQGPGRLSEALRDRQARQGAVRFRPVGIALLPRLSLFDQTVTFRHKELQAATKAIHDAESAAGEEAQRGGQGSGEAGARPRVRADREREPGEGSQSSSRLFTKNKRDAAVNKEVTGLEDSWNTKARSNYERARELAGKAAAMAR